MTLAKAMGLETSEKPPPPPPPTDADFVKPESRAIDWDLDPTDPAADYVERYIQSTRRYGEERPCVHAAPSRQEGARTLVDTRDSAENGCKGTDAVRDTFAVDVAHDRLELADPSRGAPLADWPDGSSTTSMAAPAPREGPPIDKWTSAIPKALKSLELAPLRVQFYGRGTYPVISVAGWYGGTTPTSPPALLAEDAKRICGASLGFPVGILSQKDRATVLRIKCPNSTRWDHF
jgi:hypothetical protein